MLNKTNFSNTNFRNITLNGTILNRVNLKGADLRGTFSNIENFKDCVFNFVTLEDALLYRETEEEFLFLKDKSTPYDLISQYSNLRKKIRLHKEKGLVTQENILLKQAEALKNFLKVITLDLTKQNLRNFDLTNLDLNGAFLTNAQLQNVRFSNNVVIPDYAKNLTLLFDLWIDGNEKERKYIQVLINCGFKLFKGIDITRLKAINWGNKNLENANFENIDLSNCDFRNVKLKNLNLKRAYLEGVRLSENVIVPGDGRNKYNTILLFNLWVDGNDEEREYMQSLLNCGLNLFGWVENYRLKKVNWSSKNLENADFTKAKLQGCNFREANLKNCNLTKNNLTEVDFTEANLTGVDLEKSLSEKFQTSSEIILRNKDISKLKEIYENTIYDFERRYLAKQILLVRGFF